MNCLGLILFKLIKQNILSLISFYSECLLIIYSSVHIFGYNCHMIIGFYNFPNFISYLGLFFSFFAYSILLNEKNIFLAIIFFMLSGLCDLYDGFLARKMKSSRSEKIFGGQIDSLVDLFSFGITPIMFGLFFGLKSLFDFLIYFLYLLAAIIRLAYFNYLSITNPNKKIKFYTGLPVTYSSLILPIFILFSMITKYEGLLRSCYLILAVLFVLKINIPKPNGKFYYIFPLLFIGYLIVYVYLFKL